MLPRQQPARRPRINYLPKRSDFMSIRRPFNPSHDEISRDRTVLLSPNRAPAFLRCTYPQQPHNRGRLCIGRANKEGRASEDALPYLGLTALSDWFILTNEGVNKWDICNKWGFLPHVSSVDFLDILSIFKRLSRTEEDLWTSWCNSVPF